MKIRLGFVSNSSSSSFILAASKELKKSDLREIVKKSLEKAVDQYVDEIVTILLSEGPKTIEEIADEEGLSVEEFLKEYDYDGIYKKALKRNMKLYVGAASSDGEMSDMLLCDMSLNVDSPDLIMQKEGGY